MEIILGWLNGKTGKPRFWPLEIKCHPFSIIPMWPWANSPCQAVGLLLTQLSGSFKKNTKTAMLQSSVLQIQFFPHVCKAQGPSWEKEQQRAQFRWQWAGLLSGSHNHYILDWRQHLPWACALSPHRDSQPNPQDIASHSLPCNASLESNYGRYNLPCTFSWTGVWILDDEYSM